MVIPAGDGMVLCCVDVDSVTHENIQQFQECSRQVRAPVRVRASILVPAG